MIINQDERKKIIAFGGGKGGTGRSLIASSVAILLASQGRKVVLVDMDLGGSNAHTYLDIKNQYIGVANWLASDELEFTDLVQETPYRNLYFVAGDVLVPSAASLMTPERHRRTMEQIAGLSYDYILLDLPAGSSQYTLDYFMLSNSGVLVTQPELTSILNSFNFMKSALYSHIVGIVESWDNKEALERVRGLFVEEAPNSTPPLSVVLEEIEAVASGIGVQIREELNLCTPFIVLNKIRSPSDIDFGQRLRTTIRKNLVVECESLGGLYYEDRLVAQQDGVPPIVQGDSDLGLVEQLQRVCQKILFSPDFPIMPLDLDQYKDSFELTAIEVENDWQEYQKRTKEEFPLLEKEELLATIETQRERLAQLGGGDAGDNKSLTSSEIMETAAHINERGRMETDAAGEGDATGAPPRTAQ